MKRIDVSKMMLWRQTRPLLERLEDRLVPGETLSALLLGAGAGWFGGSLPVPSTDSSASTESTAVLSWASTSSATAAAGSDDSTVDWGDWDSGASVAVEATSATDTTDGVTAAPESATMDQIFADDFSAGDFSSLERFTGSSSGSYESAHASAPAMMGGGGAAFTPAVNIGASVASMGGAQTMDNSGLVSLMAAQPTASVSSASTVTASPANTSVAPVSHSTSTSAVVSQAASTTAVASPASDSSEVAADPGGNMPMLTHNPSPQGSSPTGYTPQQMRHAYGFDQLTQTGAGQTIYIIDAYSQPNIASDLQTFDAQFGLPNPTLNILTPQGSARYNSGWGQEISLDVEWAHAIAPGATIDLV